VPGEDDQSATSRNCQDREPTVRLAFIGKDPDSNPTGSPTVYRTDRDSWVVQGWVVTDPEALAQMDIPDGRGCVEVPNRMVQFFRQKDRAIDNR
jgi:hypothetical protein